MDAEDKILDFILKAVLICAIFMMIAFVIIVVIQVSNHKYEPTDINHDGVTDIKDLVIVRRKIIKKGGEIEWINKKY